MREGKKEASFLEVRGASLRQGILSLRSAIFLKNGRSLDGAEHRGMTLESYFHSNGRSLDGAEHRGMTSESYFHSNGRSLDGAEHRGMTSESYFHSDGRSLDGAEHRGMTLEKGNVILNRRDSGVVKNPIVSEKRCDAWHHWILRRGLRMTMEKEGLRMTRERLEQFKQLLATKQLSTTITTVVA